MLTIEDHIDNLVRHINLVREACLLLGTRLIKAGEENFGRLLIAKGFQHDVSKFYGVEWDFLHAGKDVPKKQLELAIKQHVATNDHHPEYHGTFDDMPALCVAEFLCDVYARSQEFGTNLREWIEEDAVKKYEIDTKGDNYKLLNKYLDILLENHFK